MCDKTSEFNKPRSAGVTDTGNVRSVNQDDYHRDPDEKFFIVADGMGGHAGGQEASQIATRTITNYLKENWNSDKPSKQLLTEAFKKANEAILQDQQNHSDRSDSGTTAVVVVLRNEESMVAHVGDSRLYRFRKDEIEQITEDHTWVARSVKLGQITQEEARIHPWRHVLSQCLGRKDLQLIDIQPLEIQSGDRLVLCSDGLTEELTPDIICDLLKSGADCEAVANNLVNTAKDKGGHDNITVIVVNID